MIGNSMVFFLYFKLGRAFSTLHRASRKKKLLGLAFGGKSNENHNWELQGTTTTGLVLIKEGQMGPAVEPVGLKHQWAHCAGGIHRFDWNTDFDEIVPSHWHPFSVPSCATRAKLSSSWYFVFIKILPEMEGKPRLRRKLSRERKKETLYNVDNWRTDGR